MTTATSLRSPLSTAHNPKRRIVLASRAAGPRPVSETTAASSALALSQSFAAKRVGYVFETVAAGIMIAGYLVLALFG